VVKSTKISWFHLVTILGSYLLSHVAFESFQDKDTPSILELWNRWDSPHYLDIAEKGYTDVGESRLFIVFFPLYPFLIWLFAIILENYKLSALVVSNLAYVIACFYLYRLALKDYTNEIALRSVFLYVGISHCLFPARRLYRKSVLSFNNCELLLRKRRQVASFRTFWDAGFGYPNYGDFLSPGTPHRISIPEGIPNKKP